jgi:hypothetical protein
MKTTRHSAKLGGAAVALTLALALSGAHAHQLKWFVTVSGVNYTTAVTGGLRGVGSGAMQLSGVQPGSVVAAYFFWHGHGSYDDFNLYGGLPGTAVFDGHPLTGQSVGISAPNLWGNIQPFLYFYGEAFRADVTQIVNQKGAGTYSISNFFPFGANVQGASLLVFFTDPDPAKNNGTFVVYNGNDCNEQSIWDQIGWNLSIPSIAYNTGDDATLELHVSDGQAYYYEAPVYLNGQFLTPPIGVNQYGQPIINTFVGSAPYDPTSGYDPTGFYTGSMWDVFAANIDSFLAPGVNNLQVNTGFADDALSLILAVVGVRASGGVPPEPPPPPPADNRPPVIQCPAAIQLGCAPATGLSVEVAVDVSDPDLNDLTVTWTVDGFPLTPVVVPASGPPTAATVRLARTFLPGTHSVSATVSDGYANVSCSVSITIIKDKVAPTVSCPPPITVQADASGQAVAPDILPQVTAADDCGAPTLTQSPAAGTVIGVGDTTITVTATDVGGNQATCATTLTVVPPPDQAPVIECAVGCDTLWPPNHVMVNVDLSLRTENVAGAVQIVVYSNQPDVTQTGCGAFSPDAAIVDGAQVWVRRERRGDRHNHTGRVYLIVVTGVNNIGQSATCTATVGVPHDQSAAARRQLASQMAAAQAYYTLNSAPPPDFVQVGIGPVIGPKQLGTTANNAKNRYDDDSHDANGNCRRKKD